MHFYYTTAQPTSTRSTHNPRIHRSVAIVNSWSDWTGWKPKDASCSLTIACFQRYAKGRVVYQKALSQPRVQGWLDQLTNQSGLLARRNGEVHHTLLSPRRCAVSVYVCEGEVVVESCEVVGWLIGGRRIWHHHALPA